LGNVRASQDLQALPRGSRKITALHESGFGTKRTCRSDRSMSVLEGQSGRGPVADRCPLLALLGHCTMSELSLLLWEIAEVAF
jgi:hypothetical protein